MGRRVRKRLGKEGKMKKILLIGELSEIAKSLNECLENDFQVQLCSEELENAKAMIKITKPDMVIFCQNGVEETDSALFEWFQEKCPELPVLGITTSDGWKQYRDYYKTEQFDVLFRPVKKGELLEKCYQMLSLDTGNRSGQRTREREKILVVDDSALLLRNMKSMLEKYYTVCLAKSGEQALTLIPREKPDLILLDYEMEGMDGRDTFEAIKEDEDSKYIPVVFLTSIADRKAVYSVLKSKPAGYILKPPEEEKLLETIREVLG